MNIKLREGFFQNGDTDTQFILDLPRRDDHIFLRQKERQQSKQGRSLQSISMQTNQFTGGGRDDREMPDCRALLK